MQELCESIPSLREALEERIQDMVALHEEPIWKSKDENTKSHEDLKTSLSALIAKVKALVAAKDGSPSLPIPQNRSSGSCFQIFLSGGGFEMPSQQRFQIEERQHQNSEVWRQRWLVFPALNGEKWSIIFPCTMWVKLRRWRRRC